jgi:uncharacterized membrane protein
MNYQAKIRTWADHFAPAWFVWGFLAVRYLTFFVKKDTPQDTLAEVVFGMLSFWLWAITTNVHSERLARTNGRNQGTKDERKKEHNFILFMTVITLLIYMVCSVDGINMFFRFIAAALAFYLPIFFLGEGYEG